MKKPHIPDLKLALDPPKGFAWCVTCAAMQPAEHVCNDPIEHMNAEQLRALVRTMRCRGEPYESALIHAAWNASPTAG